MKRLLLVLMIFGCSEPVIEETSLIFNAPPTAEEVPADPCSEVEDDLWDECQSQHTPENEQRDMEPPRAVGIPVAPMRRAQRIRLARERAPWVVPLGSRDIRRETIQALLRMTASEEGWNYPPGALALYQTTYVSRGCMTPDRISVRCSDPRARRRLGRAPVLAAMWNHSPHATGRIESRTRRGRWISHVTSDCREPDNWPEHARDGSDHAPWSIYEDRCEILVQQITLIVDGESEMEACPEDARPITWGCDPFRRRALCDVLNRGCSRVYDEDGDLRLNRQGTLVGCNDTPIARDRRGLERLDCGETENAYWCRPGTPHCGTLPRSERVLHERLRLEEQRAADELRDREDQVQEPSEGVLGGGVPDAGQVVLDLLDVPGDRERQAPGPS